MAILRYITREGIHPQGLSKVFFCCRPEDHAQYFRQVTEQILHLQNCSIWYLPPENRITDRQLYLEELSMMQLFVMPVTRKLLTEPNRIMDLEFPFAVSHRIPVLPLMQEPGLEMLFNRKCGDLQFLDPNSKDPTAVLFEEKLKSYLHSVLVSDGLAETVRKAFDAYIFLSYRKKDRKQAQELMRLIHSSPECRDVAIWYDEFLTPGEDFNESIRKAMENSAMVALAVTPNLLEEGNYVMRLEYPAARDLGKPVLAVEMDKTDRNRLESSYRGLSGCTGAEDRGALERSLQAALRGISLRKKNDPFHNYLIGLAYLDGIDVEKNHAIALELITQAAEAGVTDAADKLVTMYSKGQGVERSVPQATQWKIRLVGLRMRDFNEKATEENCLKLLEEMRDLADVLVRMGETQRARQLYTQMEQVARGLEEHYPSDSSAQHLEAALACLGSICAQQENYSQALEYYQKSEQCLLTALRRRNVVITEQTLQAPAEAAPMLVVLMSDLCVCLGNLGDAQVRLGMARQSIQLMENAQSCFDRMLRYLLSDALKDRYPGYKNHLSIAYSRLGDMEYYRAHDDAARDYYLKALHVDEERLEHARENHDNEALDSYALSCYSLAMANPDHPDKEYLLKAVEIWRTLAQWLPEFPEYRERLAQVEPLLEKLQSGTFTPEPKPKAAVSPTRKTRPKPRKPEPPKVDPKAAFEELVQKAADWNNREAAFQVAQIYYEGKIVPKDLQKAAEYACRSASRKNLPGYDLAVRILLEQGSEQYAIGWAKSATRWCHFEPLKTVISRCSGGKAFGLRLYALFARIWCPIRRRFLDGISASGRKRRRKRR